MPSSRLPGFHRLTPGQRRSLAARWARLTPAEARALRQGLDAEVADRMVENVVGVYSVPLGIATNFHINGRDFLVPMAIEEPSVVAAASHGAKLARSLGGFRTWTSRPEMVGQVQLAGAPARAAAAVAARKDALMAVGNGSIPSIVKRGGGVRGVETRWVRTRRGRHLVVHFVVDVREAMGANAVNAVCEATAPLLEDFTGGRAVLRILTNLCDRRTVRARAAFPREELGPELVRSILDAGALAEADPYRAATHNKGILNGICAVAVATGNDTRAVEAGAHAYAARSGRYSSLTAWRTDRRGHLVGELEVPLAVGTVGGPIEAHPGARACLKMLGARSSAELAGVMAAAGLACNFAALRAIVLEGIRRGHMELHARSVAAAAGARGREVEEVAARMASAGDYTAEGARRFLSRLRRGVTSAA